MMMQRWTTIYGVNKVVTGLYETIWNKDNTMSLPRL